MNIPMTLLLAIGGLLALFILLSSYGVFFTFHLSLFTVLAIVFLFYNAYLDAEKKELTIIWKETDVTVIIWAIFSILLGIALVLDFNNIVEKVSSQLVWFMLVLMIVCLAGNITKYDKMIITPFILIDPMLVVILYSIITVGVVINNKIKKVNQEHPFLTWFAILYFGIFVLAFSSLLSQA